MLVIIGLLAQRIHLLVSNQALCHYPLMASVLMAWSNKGLSPPLKTGSNSAVSQYKALAIVRPQATLEADIANDDLRWFETVFHFPFQLNFMKGLLICSKRLLLLVDSRCYNNFSTYQLLYSH